MRRPAAALVLVASLGLAGAACSASTDDDSGATTNLDEVGPQIAKLRLEVSRLRREVRALEEQIAQLTPTTTVPEPAVAGGE